MLEKGYLGFPEIGEQEYCKKVLKHGMRTFDIGANIGQFTMLFASLVGPSGRVFAFEPCASTMSRLKAHILLNGFENVTTEQFAVCGRNGNQITLNIFPQGYSVWNTCGNPKMFSRDTPKQLVHPIGQEVVRGITIDRYCNENNIKFIDYLKVDVEGAELDALKGCRNLLKNRAVHYVQFEVSQDMIEGMGLDGTEVFKFLNEFDYSCHPISSNGELLPPVLNSKTSFANFIAVSSY